MVSAGLPGLPEKPCPPSPSASSLGAASFVEEAPTAITPKPTCFAAEAATMVPEAAVTNLAPVHDIPLSAAA